MADSYHLESRYSRDNIWYDCHDYQRDSTSSSRPLLQTGNTCSNLNPERGAARDGYDPEDTQDPLRSSPEAPWSDDETTFASQHPDERFADRQGWSPTPEPRALHSSRSQTPTLPTPEPPNEMSFMEWYPKGEATISFHVNESRVDTISGINVWVLEERCPLLAAAFEDSSTGPQLFLESLSSSTALPLVRYLYTGSYAPQGLAGGGFEDVPTSVLLHCQLFHLGDLYDIDDLKTQAYVNVFRQCEFGCSSPDQPIDLCAAIRYMYTHLRKHENLVDAIIQYCVSCLLRHRLAEDPAFRELAYELRPFHQDLCSSIRNAGFEDESKSRSYVMHDL
nr:hypothetical protein CFP56_21975 [Quercus suber]